MSWKWWREEKRTQQEWKTYWIGEKMEWGLFIVSFTQVVETHSWKMFSNDLKFFGFPTTFLSHLLFLFSSTSATHLFPSLHPFHIFSVSSHYFQRLSSLLTYLFFATPGCLILPLCTGISYNWILKCTQVVPSTIIFFLSEKICMMRCRQLYFLCTFSYWIACKLKE